MPTVIFSFHLRAGANPDDLSRSLVQSASIALASEMVESWTLHRVLDLPGSSDQSPAFVALAEIANLDRWSEEDGDAIAANQQESLGEFASRIEMTAIDDPITRGSAP